MTDSWMMGTHPTTVGPRLRPLLDCRFRVHQGYQLVAHERLPAERRAAFAGLAADPDHYGLLVPRRCPELGIMAVDRDGARLLLALREPGVLADEMRAGLRPDGDRRLARLVLDGILEVDLDGRFLTGPAACRSVLAQAALPPRPAGSIAALSHAAMRWAEALPIDDPELLSSWLYGYNCLPVSPTWRRRFDGRERVDELLGLGRAGATGRILDRSYVAADLPCWRSWHLDGKQPGGGEDHPSYKLYVSPRPGALGEVFRAAVRCFAAVGVPAFKLGRDVHGLLRPDKLIAYLDDRAAVDELAASLAASLAGCPAQGVPFTAALTDDGLLSWGMDPPRSHRIPGWSGVESWRIWVTNRLARNILRARALGSGGLEPWHYALVRLCIEGVDTDGWLPTPAIWKESEVPS